MTAWTVKDDRGRLLAAFVAGTRLEVARKVMPGPSDAFRLEVSRSYRELFERALAQVLLLRGWQIVAIRSTTKLEHHGHGPSAIDGAIGRAA
jgi:hypothetical protein